MRFTNILIVLNVCMSREQECKCWGMADSKVMRSIRRRHTILSMMHATQLRHCCCYGYIVLHAGLTLAPNNHLQSQSPHLFGYGTFKKGNKSLLLSVANFYSSTYSRAAFYVTIKLKNNLLLSSI